MKVNWGVLTAAAAVLLGGYLLFGYHGPHQTFAFYAAFALILYAFLGASVRNMLLKRRLRKEGLVGTAQLIRTETTGTTINNAPVMRLFLAVTGQNGETWEATIRQLVSLSNLYAMVPGTTFPVLYDPRDRSKVILDNRPQEAPASVNSTQFGNAGQSSNPYQLGNAGVSVTTTVSSTSAATGLPQDFSGGGEAAATTQAYQEMKATQDLVQQRLATVGTLAKAKVLTCVPLPATINHKDALMLLMLEIQPDYGPAFSGQVAGFIDSTRTDRYAPGSLIYVKYDPADKSQIALVGSERPLS